MNETQRLTEQNNGESWLDCEARGLTHLWGREEEVKSAYGSEIHPVTSKVRRCKRCPVVIMNVPRS
jgi:hypothetical protein